MHNPTVSLLAVAAAAGSVLASDTPTTRAYWKKVGGEWKYMPEEVWKTATSVQPTGTLVPQVVLPLQETPAVSVPVVPRWVRGGAQDAPREFLACRNQKREAGEEQGEEVGQEEKKGDEEDSGDDMKQKRDDEDVEDEDDEEGDAEEDSAKAEDVEYETEAKKLEARKRKGVVCNVL